MTSLTPNLENICIVASDLDGTLLAPDHKLSAYTKQILKQLHAQGFHFIFATGRHHVDVASIRETAGIPAHMITSNGARVHDLNDALMYSKDVDADLIQPIVDLFENDADTVVHIYKDDQWMINQETDYFKQFHKDSGYSYKVFEQQAAPTQGIAKLFFTHNDHDHLVDYETQLNQRFGARIEVAFSTPQCLEVMASGVSKGEALKAVAQSLGYSLDNCIAFGDGMNDVEMLSMAKHGKVMQTSHPKVKQALPVNEVIGSHADDAVAHYLADHLLN
ncbi:hydrolase [Vibrio sp. qd031]|uniref:Cof-type HAD-IIB family hydrolase n=1 Tax=Vibrio ulleungensis TaxID=2807619 RepID=A0ABS2HKK4_9VIBR|nr:MULTISPECIES: Cof-type HAD-IIB family hydrolase [Vibrio]MBM7037579.1 Cof-type HAD-IIB family hydrolase [Vibrio ulleungensis]ORT51753.1 hydrolase [Vibrio sp. qd031]